MARLFRISKKQTKPGYIYVISRSDGLRKIGLTIDPNERLESLKRDNREYSLAIEFLYSVPDMHKCEKALHNYFTDKRIYGEWFNLSYSDLSELDAIVGGMET